MSNYSANAMRVMRDIAEESNSPEQAKQNILKHLGDHGTEVLHAQVLVAHYVKPAKTKGGIILTDTNVKEDRYQGNIFLVVATGPAAFKDDNIAKFHGKKLKKGEWVMAMASDGIAMDINGVPCRLYQDSRILMKVKNPEIYY